MKPALNFLNSLNIIHFPIKTYKLKFSSFMLLTNFCFSPKELVASIDIEKINRM